MSVPALVHRGIAYTDSAELGTALAPTVAAALTGGRTVTVALEEPTAASLRAALGGDHREVEFLDITLLVTEHARSQGRPDAFWLRLEAALDAALAGLPATLWCAYRESLPAYLQCHREIGSMGEPHRNDAYRTPPDVVKDLPVEAPAAPPRHARTWHFDAHDLTTLRRELTAAIASSGLDEDAGEDLVYACSEVATNAVEHGTGTGTGTAWTWIADDEVVCQVADAGRITDPFPGVVPPPVDQDRGRGLWLARALCDEVEVASGPEGTVVRLARRLVRSEPTTRQTR